MRIFKIAADPTQRMKDDIRDLKKDCKDLQRDLKKVERVLNDLNIGQRKFYQHLSPINSIQRKIERLEKLEQEWKNFKGTVDNKIKKTVEIKTRSLGNG